MNYTGTLSVTDEAVELLKSMLLIRRFEERFKELRDNGKARGGIALAIGQEAVAVGVCSALRIDDYITSTHRGDAHCLAKGADPSRLLAECLGRSDGYCGGKGGAMHTAIVEMGVMGTNGIVGAGLPIANGLALASKRTGSDRIAVSFFGDGAINTGACYEALNMASAWALPVVFVCENNLYAISTRITTSTSSVDLYKRAEALGMMAFQVDGNDVLAVRDAASKAIERARKGGGPTFLECLTYRWQGWGWKDKDLGLKHYRSEAEWLSWKERCPIMRFRQLMRNKGIFSEELETKIETEVEEIIQKAIELALASPEPDPRELENYVYS